MEGKVEYVFYSSLNLCRCTLKDGTVLSDEILKSVLYEDELLIFSHVEGPVKPAKAEEIKLTKSHELTVSKFYINSVERRT